MTTVRVTIGDTKYTAMLEEARAPATCAAFRSLLPLKGTLLQARWSGQAAWIPLDELHLPVGKENQLHRPDPGQLLFYPEGESSTEILLPYGVTAFAAQCGPLSGNHFLTLDVDAEQLQEIGRKVWWEGAQEILFDLTSDHQRSGNESAHREHDGCRPESLGLNPERVPSPHESDSADVESDA